MQVRLPVVLTALLFAAAAVFFAVSGLGKPTEQPQDGTSKSVEQTYGGLMVFAVDVGQGDCFLLVSPNGRTMLVDSGEASEADRVLDFLDDHGVNRLDIVVATHPHTDHIGGMSRILTEYDAGVLLLPQTEYDTKTYKNLLETAEEEDVECVYVWSGDEVEWDTSCEIDILSPVKDVEYSDSDMNQWSIMFRVSCGDTSMMFTGDAETHAEQAAMLYNYEELFDADVLKVAHHGSAYSSSIGFLEAVSPSIAIISVGEGNSYGHPDFDTLNKLGLMGVSVYRTDISGDISILLDGENVTVDAE